MARGARDRHNRHWHSPRVEQELHLARWGHFGQPVLVFPTAGGDAEEIERMLMIQALSPLLDAGRIKVYSIDSVAARNWGDSDLPGAYKVALLDRFQQTVRHEVVPAIRDDCGGSELELIAAGASIGAFNALSSLCRWPDAFHTAVCLSGSYDVERFMKNVPPASETFHHCSPLRWMPSLADGKLKDLLRTRRVLLAHGGGRWEDPEQDWNMARLLGSLGVPNRVDPWGEGYDHDWPTWRAMLPRYLDQITAESRAG